MLVMTVGVGGVGVGVGDGEGVGVGDGVVVVLGMYLAGQRCLGDFTVFGKDLTIFGKV